MRGASILNGDVLSIHKYITISMEFRFYDKANLVTLR